MEPTVSFRPLANCGETRSQRLLNQRKWFITRHLEPTVRIGQSMPVFNDKAATRLRLRKQNLTLSHLIISNTVTEGFTEAGCHDPTCRPRQMSFE
jgi:hypothetical protein